MRADKKGKREQKDGRRGKRGARKISGERRNNSPQVPYEMARYTLKSLGTKVLGQKSWDKSLGAAEIAPYAEP
eukprot:115935-Prorocentrum_minimum.AAC.1